MQHNNKDGDGINFTLKCSIVKIILYLSIIKLIKQQIKWETLIQKSTIKK